MSEPITGQEATKLEFYGAAPFVSGLDELRAHMELPENPRILYPGSSTHTDVADYFGRHAVFHVDLDPSTVTSLEASGYLARQGNVHDLIEEPFDLLVTLNTYTGVLSPEEMVRLIKPEGYLVTNMFDYANADVKEGTLKLITVTDTGDRSMGPHFQENRLGLYQLQGPNNGS